MSHKNRPCGTKKYTKKVVKKYDNWYTYNIIKEVSLWMKIKKNYKTKN